MGLFDDILDTTVKFAGVTLSVAGGVAVNTVRGAAAAVGDRAGNRLRSHPARFNAHRKRRRTPDFQSRFRH